MKKFLHNQEISQKIITERLLFARSSKVFRSRIRIKLIIKASRTVTIFYEKKKKSDPSFRESRGGGEAEIFSPFRRLPPRLDVSPRDSFKGITPLAFPRQPRRRDWHSRRVLNPFADRRDTSTPRHEHAAPLGQPAFVPRNGGQRLAPTIYPYTFSSKYLFPIARNDTLFTVIIFLIVVVISYNFKGGSFQSLSEEI